MQSLLLNLAAVLLVVLGVPALLLFLGLRGARRASSPTGRFVGGTAAAAGASAFVLVGWAIFRMAPGHSRIFEQGHSPDGREFFVVQSHNGFPDGLGEPYTISLYVRDDAGLWRWHYLDHEGLPWRSAEVVFRGDRAGVLRDGEPFRDVELEREAATAEAPDRGRYMALRTLAAELTPADVAELHRAKAGR